jgi:hypothetical protein
LVVVQGFSDHLLNVAHHRHLLLRFQRVFDFANRGRLAKNNAKDGFKSQCKNHSEQL